MFCFFKYFWFSPKFLLCLRKVELGLISLDTSLDKLWIRISTSIFLFDLSYLAKNWDSKDVFLGPLLWRWSFHLGGRPFWRFRLHPFPYRIYWSCLNIFIVLFFWSFWKVFSIIYKNLMIMGKVKVFPLRHQASYSVILYTRLLFASFIYFHPLDNMDETI